MPVRPVSFQGTDLKQVGNQDLDPQVLPLSVVRTDGSTPFTQPQQGVAPLADADLTTREWVRKNAGDMGWQGAVLSIVGSLPGSPSTGDRYILSTDDSINQWSGTAWETQAPSEGWVLYNLDAQIFQLYLGGSWQDLSAAVNHETMLGLLGGDIGDHYHFTYDQHQKLTVSQAAKMVLAAPLNAAGIPDWRALDAADIQTGTIPPVRGGFGLDLTTADGYVKWASGTPTFSATIPFSDIDGAPSGFTPAEHAETHEAGGDDELELDATQITTGLLSRARGGTGASGASLPARYALISGTSASTPVSYRALTPDDISGATSAYQVLQRNASNTGNVWGALDLTGSNAVPNTRVIGTSGYLSGGGDLTADRALTWLGVDVLSSAVLTGRRPIINFGTGFTVTDDSLNNRINVTAAFSGAITSLTANNWKLFYSDGSGNVQELALGATGTVLTSGGASAAPTFSSAPGGGEVNTASNVGTAGVGPFKQKTGVNLEFKKINAGSSKVTVTDDTGNSEIDIDVVPANMGLVSQWQYVILSDGGAGHTHTVSLTEAEAATVISGTPVVKASSTTSAHSHNVTWSLVSDRVVVTLVQTVGHTHPATAANQQADTNTGETNTASNVNTAGVGVFKQKTGVNLEFRGINAGSSKITVTNDSGNNEIDIDVAEANLSTFVGDSGSGGVKGDVPAPAAGDAAANKFLNANGTWTTAPGAAGGEANTASNVGVGGVGLFKQKNVYDLEFRNINAGSNKVTVTLDNANNEVDVDVVPSELGSDLGLLLSIQVFCG
jgi:hypothetical protein